MCSAMSPQAGVNLVEFPYSLFIQKGKAGVLYDPHSTHMNGSDSKIDFFVHFVQVFFVLFSLEIFFKRRYKQQP